LYNLELLAGIRRIFSFDFLALSFEF